MIKLKFINKETQEKISKLMKSFGNWIMVGIVGLSAFFLGYYYPKIKQSVLGEVNSQVTPKTSAQSTISVTDRGELMILDRQSGKFELYEESVGHNIFKAYGSRIVKPQ